MPPPALPSPEETAVTARILPGADLASQGSSASGAPVMVRLEPPDGSERTPADICCVVDVSGSMSAEAMLKTESGDNTGHGLTVLDIVKHALKTIIKNMKDFDRMAVVAYSNDARTIFGLTDMDAAGQTLGENKLDEMHPSGMTNLWDGLKTGMELLKTGAQPGRLQHIMLFTDGLPNINPPRGILPMLKRLKDKEGGKLPCTINTYGFGYELDSELLSQLAVDGSGAYAFIPDAGFVGTVFVNAMANLMATVAKDTTVTLEPQNGASFVDTGVLGGHPVKKDGAKLVVNVGSLQFGQTKDIVVQMNTPSVDGYLAASVEYATRAATTTTITCQGAGPGEPEDFPEVEKQRIRLRVVDVCRNAMRSLKMTPADKASGKALPLPAAQEQMTTLASEIEASSVAGEESIVALLEDVTGQVTEALSREEWYTKWGIHYLPSLMFAHLMQQCNNFKDAGVQAYGGDLFQNLRDAADDVFLQLPAPTPSAPPPPPAPVASAASMGGFSGMGGFSAPVSRPAVSMSQFHDRYGG